MANQLKMAMIGSILTLRQRGWSCRRIARELGVNRETVSRYVRLAAAQNRPEPAADSDSNPAIAPTGSEGSNPGNAHTGSAG